MKKIKILEMIGDSSLAGAPRHLLGILENLDRQKFEIYCISPTGPLAGEIRKIHPHVELEVINMRSRLDRQAIKEIRKYIKLIKPQLIHIHGNRAGSVGRLASIGLGIPVIYTEHLWTNDFKLKNPLLDYFHHIGAWFLDLFTSMNIAVSGAVKDFLIQSRISYDKKIKVIYNGIEPTKTKANLFNSKEVVIGTVATLLPLKGIQFLIEALPGVIREFPEAKLEIIGEGPYKKKLQQKTKKMKLLKHVKFLGFSPDVEKELAKMDLYVQPSLSESFGLAIIQAMSVGLPIIATRTGGIPEVVTEEKSGILVEPANPKQLREAIIKVLRDKTLAKRIGEMARKEAMVRFNLKDMIQELENTYEEVVKNPAFPE